MGVTRGEGSDVVKSGTGATDQEAVPDDVTDVTNNDYVTGTAATLAPRLPGTQVEGGILAVISEDDQSFTREALNDQLREIEQAERLGEEHIRSNALIS